MEYGVGKMAQDCKELVTKSDNLSLTPWAYRVEEKNQLPKLSLTSTHATATQNKK